jgi:transcriptional regulator with XRE-family HTH domain
VTSTALKLEMVSRGIKQAEVAAKLGLSAVQLSRALGKATPSPEFASQFLGALDEISREKAAQITAEAQRQIARLLGGNPSDEVSAEAEALTR